MKRVLKKQDRNDFISRIERLDPAFAAAPASARMDRKPWEMEKKSALKSESPILMSILGFGLALVALLAAADFDMVQALLIQSGWPVQFIQYGMNGVSILIIGLVVFFLANILRILNPRATGRWNAAGLVVGAVAAIGISSLDDRHLQAGYDLAGIEGPGDILALAKTRGEQLASVDWASVVMVSSSPK